jgi:hypothetical protein
MQRSNRETNVKSLHRELQGEIESILESGSNAEELVKTRPLHYACSQKASKETSRNKPEVYLLRQGRDRFCEQAFQNIPDEAAFKFGRNFINPEPSMENLLFEDDDDIIIARYPRSLLEGQMASMPDLREEEEKDDWASSPRHSHSLSPHSLFQNTARLRMASLHCVLEL